jgi:hypothetical protein
VLTGICNLLSAIAAIDELLGKLTEFDDRDTAFGAVGRAQNLEHRRDVRVPRRAHFTLALTFKFTIALTVCRARDGCVPRRVRVAPLLLASAFVLPLLGDRSAAD